MKTIFERVTAPLERERAKHGKPAEHVEATINRFSNMELLERISDAIDELLVEQAYRSTRIDPD